MIKQALLWNNLQEQAICLQVTPSSCLKMFSCSRLEDAYHIMAYCMYPREVTPIWKGLGSSSAILKELNLKRDWLRRGPTFFKKHRQIMKLVTFTDGKDITIEYFYHTLF